MIVSSKDRSVKFKINEVLGEKIPKVCKIS